MVCRITVFNDDQEIEGFVHGNNVMVNEEELMPDCVPMVNSLTGIVEVVNQPDEPEDISSDPHDQHEREEISKLKPEQKYLGHLKETVFDGLKARVY